MAGDGLAALAFPNSVIGPGILLARVQLVATGLGQTQLVVSHRPGDLAEGFAMDPAGFASVMYTPATITVVRDSPTAGGWNWVDVGILLTANQPTYWSAATGAGGVNVPPFTVLDPGPPPGQPAPDGSGERVLRGFILAWAVNADGAEIRWNHLSGGATVVNCDRGTAWEYSSYAFQVVSATAHGTATGSPGVLALDGQEYDNAYDLLLLDFYAAGSQPFGLNSGFGRTRTRRS